MPLDRILQLPIEISDQIFSLLSTPTLDAARFTCRAWWDKIMSSCWILSQVLEVWLTHSREEGLVDGRLRKLAKRLAEHEDRWSTRYRKYSYDFILPNDPNAIPTYDPGQKTRSISQRHLISTDFSSSCNIITFLIREVLGHGLTAQVIYSVAAYRIFLASRPVLIMSRVCPTAPDAGTPCQIRLLEVNAGRIWAVNVLFSSTIATLPISLRRSFAKSDSPYEPAENFVFQHRGPPTTPGQEQQHIAFDQVGNEATALDAQWRLVERLRICRDGDRAMGPIYLAIHARSGGLFVVHVSTSNPEEPVSFSSIGEWPDHYNANQELKPLVFLSPPQHGSVFRNFASSTHSLASHSEGSLCSRILRIAIIWHNCSNLLHERPALYIYDLDFNENHRRTSQLKTWQIDLVDQHGGPRFFASLPNNANSKAEAQFPKPSVQIGYIQGQRVSSINMRAGGIHPASPYWKAFTSLCSPQQTRHDAAVGGINLSPDDGLRCYVWGPSAASDTSPITVCNFHLLFGSSHRYLGWIWMDPEAYCKSCGCSLHDHGYRITLPVVKPSSSCSTSKSWLQTLRLASPSQVCSDQGTVEHYDPPARAKALQRREDGLKEMVRSLKRDGWSNEQVEDLWTRVRWTRWGCVPKPDGWREL
ncbi:MAG: hypothetical protein M1830_002095 [Pleopsidium flavum]|nr:MAG: hypothetical protein M1830_002095 [Pleopsidium flavum]